MTKSTFPHNPESEPPPSAVRWFGHYKKLGKTEARQAFLRLLDELQLEPSSLAITDRGKKVAVIMGYKQYELLMAILSQHSKRLNGNPLAGLITKVDDLEKSQNKVNGLFQQSLKQAADLL